MHGVGNTTVVGASGDLSDFQYVQGLLDGLVTDEFTAGDGNALGPAEVHEYLARVLYARRSKLNPLWNSPCSYDAVGVPLDLRPFPCPRAIAELAA